MNKTAISVALAVTGCLLLSAGDAQAQRRGAKKVDALAADLRGPDSGKAKAAAKALAAVKGAAATGALLDGLALGLPSAVSVAALDAVAKRGDAKAYPAVVHYLRHRRASVRVAAVGAAGAMSDKRAAAKVILALRDSDKKVRAKAAGIIAEKKWKGAIEPLIALLKRGDDASAPALAALANPELARAIGELIGSAPDGLLSRCLGAILVRPDFKPEEARVEVVRVLGRIPGSDSLEQLTNYVGSLPETSRRRSRREAQAIIEQRLGGD